MFCFCCFTGLRYSDVYNLKRSDVYDDHIEVTTIKTTDRLTIPLSKYARDILGRYETSDDDKALPVTSNQKANKALKEVCRLSGIDRPVTVVDICGSRRTEIVKPKYELIGTHCGRRTFISNALSLGASPRGHEDYRSQRLRGHETLYRHRRKGERRRHTNVRRTLKDNEK